MNWASITGAPSWGGDDRIYFVSRGKNQTSGIYWVDPDEPSAVQQVSTGIEDEWLSHPDWCEQGLLFQRSTDARSPGSLELFQDGKVVSLTTPDTVDAPTWSPECAAVAWLAPTASGDAVFTAPFVSVEDGGPKLGTASRWRCRERSARPHGATAEPPQARALRRNSSMRASCCSDVGVSSSV